jgi:ribosomal protein S4E
MSQPSERLMSTSTSDLCYDFADVVTIEKTGEFFRLIYDVKGRFTIHRITAEEAKVK